MNESCQLALLQQWMLAAITHPAGVQAGAPSPVDEVILPSQQQSARERLAVYSHAYFARLLDVLRELFPCVRYAVGDELFDQFAVGYLQAHPPHSYTLHRLADRFADHLQTTCPAGSDDWAGLVVDLARLEHAIDQVFDGPGPEEKGTGVSPGMDMPLDGDCRLTLAAGFRLLAFRFPVSSYFTAWKAGQQPSWPRPGEQFVALLRRDYIVRRYELSQPQFDLLSHLAAGRTLRESLAAIPTDVRSTDDLAANVRQWFTFWAAERMFAGAAPAEPV